MTEQEALQRALALRRALGIDASFVARSAERRIVERVVGEPVEGPPEPGPREDRVAWVVTLASSPFSLELVLDDRSGELLRLRRPRGLALGNAASEGAR
jgi:hypothetical protein